MIAAVDRTQTGLAAIVGAARVVVDEKTCAAFAVEGKAPRLVVYPPCAEQTAQVLRYASAERLAVIPCRNGTKLAWGNAPHDYDLALCVKEMNRVWYYEPDDLTISVEPGMKFGDFQHFVGRHHLWLPLNPSGGASASIGGIVATNATGSYRCHYGTPRDMVLGLKIATTEGKVIKAGGRVVKNVAGYDLTRLMIGSFGTLGVIVEISFKLFPPPAGCASFVLTVATLEKARETRRALQQSALRPLRALLLDAGARQWLQDSEHREDQPVGFQIWIEVGGSKRVLDRCASELRQIALRAGVEFRALREDSPTDDVWRRLDELHPDAGAKPENWLLRASLPVAAVEEYLMRAERDLQRPEHSWKVWAEPLGGIVHLWLHSDPGPAGAEDAVAGLRRLAEDLGGSLIIETAPADNARVDAWGAVDDDFEVMRKLKKAFDPNHILSPGRFVGGL